MARRTIVSVFIALLFLAVAKPAMAQMSPECPGYITRSCYYSRSWDWWEDGPSIPPWRCWEPANNPPLYGWYCCARQLYQADGWCTSPSVADETRCPDCEAQARGGHPIDLANGNTFIEDVDIRVPGLGGGLTVARTWNSRWPATQAALNAGAFGANWRSTYEERVFFGSDNYMKYSRSDGSYWSFAYNNSAPGPRWAYGIVAPASQQAVLYYDSQPTTVTLGNGEKRIFDNTSGSLLQIVDRNGNTTQLTYDQANRLVTVTDPGGRHLYFHYENSNTYLITSVTSDVGITVTYGYDAQGRLTSVTKPDNTVVTYEYNAQSLITAVKDNEGKILESHTYDSLGRGLTSARANGVEAITVTYPQ